MCFHIVLNHFISKKINKIGIIFNLDKHDESGSHWVSMFINIKEGIFFSCSDNWFNQQSS